MAFPAWLASWKTQGRQPRHLCHRLPSAKPALEPLEDRLTPSFSAAGPYVVESWNGGYYDVKIQPGDQKVVVAGNADDRMAIARYDSVGNPDTSYGSGGPSIAPLSGVSAPALGAYGEHGYALVLQPDGKAVVSGDNGGGYSGDSFAVARFNTGGTLDSSFGSGGWISLNVFFAAYNPAGAVGLQSNGKIVVAGAAVNAGSTTPASVARFTASGALDKGGGGFGDAKKGYTLTTFGMPINGLRGLAVQPDDKVVAVGYSYTTDNPGVVVARYTAAGVLDKTFNGSGYSVLHPAGISSLYATAVALQSDGKIVVVGSSSGTDGFDDMVVARYNVNGTLDTNFGGASLGYLRLDIDGLASSTSEIANDVAIRPDGRIVVAGTLRSGTGGSGSVMIARLNTNGTPDGSFGSGGFKIGTPPAGPDYHSFDGKAVALQANGTIIVAGTDSWENTNPSDPSPLVQHPLLMRFLPTLNIGRFTASPNPVTTGNSVTLIASNVTDDTAGSTVTQVAFYQDSNGDGKLQPGSDTVLGYGTKDTSTGNWTFTFSTTGLAAGAYKLFAQGRDSYGVFSDPLLLTLQVVVPILAIGSFTASPNPVTAGSSVTLTASNIIDTYPASTVTQVAFYQDSNSNSILETGTDPLLGYGAKDASTGRWTFTFSTIGLVPGAYNLFAQALDSGGVLSDPLAVDLQVI
jgi:uncharacterized delta-60 repeat protein